MPNVITAGNSSNGGTAISTDTSGTLNIVTGSGSGANAISIDTSQNVGIGTTTPTTKLSVIDSGTGANTLLVQSGQTGTTPRSNVVLRLQTTATGRDVNIQFSDNVTNSAEIGMVGGAQYFATAGSERMRIDSSGNLLVGTTGTLLSNNTGFTVEKYAGGAYCSIGHTTSAGSGDGYINFIRNSVIIGAITQNGTANVSYVTSSDYRLKEDVQPMVGALATVSQLKPCTYKWKATGEDGQGFIAHELQAVVPDCVIGEKDAVNEDGSIKPQGIDTSFLVATLTAAIQEQQAMILELKAELDALKAKVGE
jgi:hypothetical protein